MASASVSFTFNNAKLKTVTIIGKHWTRAKEVCTSMKYQKKAGDVIIDHCSRGNIRYKHELVSIPDQEDHFKDLKTLKNMTFTQINRLCMS